MVWDCEAALKALREMNGNVDFLSQKEKDSLKSDIEKRNDWLEERNFILERKLLSNSFILVKVTVKDGNFPSGYCSYFYKYFYDIGNVDSRDKAYNDVLNAVSAGKNKYQFKWNSKIETFGVNWRERLEIRFLLL